MLSSCMCSFLPGRGIHTRLLQHVPVRFSTGFFLIPDTKEIDIRFLLNSKSRKHSLGFDTVIPLNTYLGHCPLCPASPLEVSNSRFPSDHDVPHAYPACPPLSSITQHPHTRREKNKSQCLWCNLLRPPHRLTICRLQPSRSRIMGTRLLLLIKCSRREFRALHRYLL